MTSVSFPYEEWDDINDILLSTPGSVLGHTAITRSLQLRPVGQNLELDRLATEGGAVDGVIEFVAGGIEWLRRFGLTAQEVQQRVNAFKVSNRDTPEQKRFKTELPQTELISDITNRKSRLDPNKKLG